MNHEELLRKLLADLEDSYGFLWTYNMINHIADTAIPASVLKHIEQNIKDIKEGLSS